MFGLCKQCIKRELKEDTLHKKTSVCRKWTYYCVKSKNILFISKSSLPKMKSLPLVAMMTFSVYCSNVSSHIVTPLQPDVPYLVCVERLAALYRAVCGVLDDSEAVSDYSGTDYYLPLTPGEILKENYLNSRKEDILKSCCMRPCAYAELLRSC